MNKTKAAKVDQNETNEPMESSPTSPLNASSPQKANLKLNADAVEFRPDTDSRVRPHVPPSRQNPFSRPLPSISETGADELKSPKSSDNAIGAEGGNASAAGRIWRRRKGTAALCVWQCIRSW